MSPEQYQARVSNVPEGLKINPVDKLNNIIGESGNEVYRVKMITDEIVKETEVAARILKKGEDLNNLEWLKFLINLGIHKASHDSYHSPQSLEFTQEEAEFMVAQQQLQDLLRGYSLL